MKELALTQQHRHAGRNIFRRITRFYVEGFRSMTLGRTLWMIILVKLVVLFGVLKLFFFADFLSTHYDTDNQRAAHVLDQITR